MQTYFAMTPDELRQSTSLPGPIGWMACHLDSKGTGLIDVPQYLPAGSVLLLDDSLPLRSHNPRRICQELEAAFSRLHFEALILDFQQPGNPDTPTLVQQLISLPFPVVVSSLYAVPGASILLPPPPVDTPLADYVSAWAGHPLWLELSPTETTMELTAEGTKIRPGSVPSSGTLHQEEKLHCHYQILENESAVFFHLFRTGQDLKALLQEAEGLGISGAIGLYQEIGSEHL